MFTAKWSQASLPEFRGSGQSLEAMPIYRHAFVQVESGKLVWGVLRQSGNLGVRLAHRILDWP